MISRIDYLSVAVHDADAAGEAYRRLLGREPAIQDGLGARRVWFRMPDVSLEILGPNGEGPSGDNVRQRLETRGEGLFQLGFRVDDLEGAAERFGRRGFPMTLGAGMRPWATGMANGIRLGLVTPRADAMSASVGAETATVATLDRLVIHTPDPDRALATYGARLGLELRLDRDDSKRNARQMLLCCGGCTIEIATGAKPSAETGDDRLEALVWRVADVDAARARLAAAGFEVSDVQACDDAGARVFTVRDAPGGVPTSMLEPGRESV